MAYVKKNASGTDEHAKSDYVENRVRERAYQIWQSEGQPSGQHERHWFQAKEELARGQRSEASQEREPNEDIKPERRKPKK